MKAAVLLVLLLALVSPSPAQSIDYFRDYNPLITQAEDSIVTENYGSALAAYQLAFRRVEHPFNSDLYNAALAARAADRVDLVRTYLLQLAGQGPDSDFFAANADQFQHPDLDWNPLLIYRIMGLIDYPAEVKDVLTLEYVDNGKDSKQIAIASLHRRSLPGARKGAIVVGTSPGEK